MALASQTNFAFLSNFPAAPNGMEDAYVQSQAGDPTLFSWALARTGKVNSQPGTSYTFVADDRGKLVVFGNSSDVAVTLPVATALSGLNAATTLASVFWTSVRNINVGIVTITPTGGALIDGRSSLKLGMGQGAFIFWDGTNYFVLYMAPVGGVNYQSSSTYTLLESDRERLVAMTSVTGGLIMLPATGLPTRFATVVMNTAASGSGINVTLQAATGFTVNGQSSVTLPPQVGGWLFQDTTGNWLAVIGGAGSGSGGGGSTTFGGDLVTVSPVSQKVRGFNGTLLDTATAPADGNFYQYSSTSGMFELVTDRPSWPATSIPGKPLAGQKVIIFAVPAAMIFPANFSSPNSYGTVGVPPVSGSAVFVVYKNGVQVGTVTISTSSVFTFATTGGTSFSVNAGDTLLCVAPGSQDPNMTDIGITLVGQRSQTLAAGSPVPILNDRGTYDPLAIYQPYDFVELAGPRISTYLCRVAGTTGISPVVGTTTTNWRLIAQAGQDGASGGAQVGPPGDLGGTTNAPSVTGWYGIPLDVSMSHPASGNVPVYDVTLGKWKAASGVGGGSVKVQTVDGTTIVNPATQINVPNGSLSNPSGSIAQIAGGLIFLQKMTASSSAALSSNAVFTSAFDSYLIKVINLIPVTTSVDMLVLFSTDGGSTYDTTAGHYISRTAFIYTNQGVGPVGSTSILLFGAAASRISNNSSRGCCGDCILSDPASSSLFKSFVMPLGMYFDTAVTDTAGLSTFGEYRQSAAITNIQFKFSSGNIASGSIEIYGYVKA